MQAYRAPAKVNIFLKITGRRDGYHTLLSRFMLIDDLFDTISFVPKADDAFVIEGDFSCETTQNTIYKAYRSLLEATESKALIDLMRSSGVKVEKRIPAFAGLGGGSSDAATYLRMCNDHLGLGLSIKELSDIGATVGADVPFFIHGYPSANVSGIGEVVEPYEESTLRLETLTPPIEISTPAVYGRFRECFYKELSDEEAEQLASMDSIDVLRHYDIDDANDLFAPAIDLYPELEAYVQEGWFFSGSGSSFFRLR